MSTQTIVVGYDGTDVARSAVDLAVLLAAPTRQRVLAITAYEPGATAGDPRSAASVELLDDLGGVERDALPGTALTVLSTVAERLGAELIVVGATHRGVLGRIVPGSLGQQLLQGAPCAVAVARGGPPAATIRSIAVAWDRRPQAEEALAYACHLAERHDAGLRLMSACYAPGPSQENSDPEAQSAFRTRLQADVRARAAALPVNLRAASELLLGDPGRALATACEEGVDLLVTGSRSYGPLRGAIAGSVARHLVDHASCPVLVVPRGAPTTQAPERAALAVGA